MPPERFAVIGAGIIGLATARELRRRHPDATVTVVDKEHRVAAHQTGHNSGVVHAGIYYPPGSLKATLCARGRHLLQAFCADHHLAYQECGKVVVAHDHTEIPALDAIEARATANRVPGLRRLDRAELREIEPHAAGVAGLHSPHTAIVDFSEVARSLSRGPRIDIRLGFEVTAIANQHRQVTLQARNGDSLAADRVVACAGLQADRISYLAGDRTAPVIVPFRGEYWRLRPSRTELVKGLIYPVPDPAYPFLGVHFTRRIGGAVDVGPNAVLALAREGYRRRDIRPGEVARILSWPGTWRLLGQHWRTGVRELHTSLSKAAFVAEAQRLVPSLQAGDLERAPAGVRAQALDRSGELVDDFRIGWAGRVMTVGNAPSPGASSALAIAEYLVDEMCKAP